MKQQKRTTAVNQIDLESISNHSQNEKADWFEKAASDEKAYVKARSVLDDGSLDILGQLGTSKMSQTKEE